MWTTNQHYLFSLTSTSRCSASFGKDLFIFHILSDITLAIQLDVRRKSKCFNTKSLFCENIALWNNWQIEISHLSQKLFWVSSTWCPCSDCVWDGVVSWLHLSGADGMCWAAVGWRAAHSYRGDERYEHSVWTGIFTCPPLSQPAWFDSSKNPFPLK